MWLPLKGPTFPCTPGACPACPCPAEQPSPSYLGDFASRYPSLMAPTALRKTSETLLQACLLSPTWYSTSFTALLPHLSTLSHTGLDWNLGFLSQSSTSLKRPSWPVYWTWPTPGPTFRHYMEPSWSGLRELVTEGIAFIYHVSSHPLCSLCIPSRQGSPWTWPRPVVAACSSFGMSGPGAAIVVE